MTFTESTIEQATIDWLKDLGYYYTFGPEIAFDTTACLAHVLHAKVNFLNGFVHRTASLVG